MFAEWFPGTFTDPNAPVDPSSTPPSGLGFVDIESASESGIGGNNSAVAAYEIVDLQAGPFTATASDTDWYRVNLGAGDHTIDFEVLTAGGSLSFQIFEIDSSGSHGAIIADDYAVDDVTSLLASIAQEDAGDYLIHVYGATTSSPVEYTIDFTGVS